MSKKNVVLFVVLGFICGMALTLILGWFYINNDNFKIGEEFVLEFGDTFSELPLIDHESVLTDLNSYKAEYTLIYYLDKNCGSCIESLDLASKLIQVYADFEIQNCILWAGESGAKLSVKAGIPLECNFTLNNAYINSATPTFYILDQDKTVIFKAYKLTDIVDKLMQLNIFSNIIEMINSNYIQNLSNKLYSEEKPTLVYFSMVGCPDCELVTPFIESGDIQDIYNVLVFYYDRNDVPMDKKEWIDTGGLLAKSYNISWYPSFLVIHNNGDYKIIGETPIEELKKLLINEGQVQ